MDYNAEHSLAPPPPPSAAPANLPPGCVTGAQAAAMAGHGGAPPQYNSFTSPRSAAPPQPFDANGEPQQGFFPDAGAPPPPYQAPQAAAPAMNADGKVWGRKADGKTGWVTPKASDMNNEGPRAPAPVMPVAAVAPPVAQVVPMRALRKQFSGLTGVSGAFSGKDKEEELRQERAKLEADKLAFERQKLEAERKKLEEERAKLAQPVAEDAKWYWEESPERLHLHQNLKRPHWVPYEAEATQKLETAWQSNQTSVPLNASYTANLTAMTQMKNLNGYKRRILRDARPAGGSNRDVSPPPPLAPLKVVTFDEKVEKLTCYYRLNEEQISYAEHERKARERGATVASICSAEENEAVVRVARGQFCFVGAVRIGGGNGPTSANWKWQDGKPFQYTNWSRDEPNNYMGHEDRVMIMGNGKWNDIHQGWTGPAVYRFAGKPQWYWEESAERLRNHSNLKPGTNFVPYSSNDNDKLEEMHMQHKPFCRLNPNYGVDLIKMQQTSMSTGYARRVIREQSGPQVSSPPAVIKYDRSRVAWYWEESPERMSLHSLVKPPHWVRFDPATEDKLESALQCGNAGVMTVPGKYHADIKSMMQKNVNTGFGRRIFRELA